MNDLMKKEDREIRQCEEKREPSKILEMREKITDETYIDHAIRKIATDLSHYLTKQGIKRLNDRRYCMPENEGMPVRK